MSEKQVEIEPVAGSEILAITPKELYKTRRNYFLGGIGLATLAIASINAVQLANVYRSAHHHRGAEVAVYHYQPGEHHGAEFLGHHPEFQFAAESKGHHCKKHGKSRESQEAQADAKHSEFLKIHYPGKQLKDLTESEISEIREYLRAHQSSHGAKRPHHGGKKDVKAHRDFVTKFFNGKKFHELTQEEKEKVAEYLASREDKVAGSPEKSQEESKDVKIEVESPVDFLNRVWDELARGASSSSDETEAKSTLI